MGLRHGHHFAESTGWRGSGCSELRRTALRSAADIVELHAAHEKAEATSSTIGVDGIAVLFLALARPVTD